MRSDESRKLKAERSWIYTIVVIFRPSSVVFWVLVALLLRLALWMQPLHQLANDEIEYVTVARDLLAGHGWIFYTHYHWLRAPLYPLFLAGSLWLSGGNLWLAALPNIILSVVTVPLAALLTRELAEPFRPQAATLAAVLSAILWTLATFASLYMAETLFTFLFIAALVILLRWQRAENQEPKSRRRYTHRLAMLSLAGVSMGLAILTRSVPLAFLPIIALWIALYQIRRQGDKEPYVSRFTFHISRPWISLSPCLPVSLFLACCLLTIAPWTVRNCIAYGRCIPVETGLSYNLWAFNEPIEDEATIFRTLENIPNPAERSDYATAKGLEQLRADPSILWRKLWPNWTYLWRVNPIIEDRFLLRTYYADPPPIVFLAALLFDDGWMLIIALAGVIGLARTSNRRAALLGAAWLAYVFVTTSLTHGEGRYRHFLFPVLIPCAAIALIDLWQWLGQCRQFVCRRLMFLALKGCLKSESMRGEASHDLLSSLLGSGVAAAKKGRTGDFSEACGPHNPRRELFKRLLRQGLDRMYRMNKIFAQLWEMLNQSSTSCLMATFLAVLLLITITQTYPWGWAWGGMRRSSWLLAGDVAGWVGNNNVSQTAYRNALAAEERADTWVRLGDAQRAAGEPDAALVSYRAGSALSPSYIVPGLHRGDLLRTLRRDTEARTAFDVPYADPQQVVDWAWTDIAPAPTERIAVGDGLDFGYIIGVYPAEAQAERMARWTNGRALLRFAPSPSGLLLLRLAAPRPDSSQASVSVCSDAECVTFPLDATWRTYRIQLPPTALATQIIELRSDIFLAPDGRRLGVLVDEVGR